MKQIVVPASLEQIKAVMEFLGSNMRQAELDAKLQNKLFMVVEEIFVNIASYAYGAAGGEVIVRFYVDSDKVALEFLDEGAPYNPLAKEDPDTSLSADERDIGGLGIYLVKKMMDHVTYRYEDKKNILYAEKSVRRS